MKLDLEIKSLYQLGFTRNLTIKIMNEAPLSVSSEIASSLPELITEHKDTVDVLVTVDTETNV